MKLSQFFTHHSDAYKTLIMLILLIGASWETGWGMNIQTLCNMAMEDFKKNHDFTANYQNKVIDKINATDTTIDDCKYVFETILEKAEYYTRNETSKDLIKLGESLIKKITELCRPPLALPSYFDKVKIKVMEEKITLLVRNINNDQKNLNKSQEETYKSDLLISVNKIREIISNDIEFYFNHEGTDSIDDKIRHLIYFRKYNPQKISTNNYLEVEKNLININKFSLMSIRFIKMRELLYLYLDTVPLFLKDINPTTKTISIPDIFSMIIENSDDEFCKELWIACNRGKNLRFNEAALEKFSNPKEILELLTATTEFFAKYFATHFKKVQSLPYNEEPRSNFQRLKDFFNWLSPVFKKFKENFHEADTTSANTKLSNALASLTTSLTTLQTGLGKLTTQLGTLQGKLTTLQAK